MADRYIMLNLTVIFCSAKMLTLYTHTFSEPTSNNMIVRSSLMRYIHGLSYSLNRNLPKYSVKAVMNFNGQHIYIL